MDVRRLEAFVKVFELRSFSRAGEQLYLSQPTISAHISALETELDVRLFDRLGRSILPTQAAEVLYRHARDVFTSLEAAKAEIQLLQDRVAGDLSVGGSTIPAHYVLPPLLAEFTSRHPDVRLQLKVGDSDAIIRRIAEGEDMVGMVGARVDHPELTFEPVVNDELVVIAPTRMGMGAKGPVDPAELATLPWIDREAGSGTRRTMELALAALGCELPTPIVRVESTQAAIQCARAGLGATVTSRVAAAPLLADGVVDEVRVQGLDVRREFHLVYHSRRQLFPVARYFIEFVRHECRANAAG